MAGRLKTVRELEEGRKEAKSRERWGSKRGREGKEQRRVGAFAIQQPLRMRNS